MCKKIIIFISDRIGDVIFCTPAIKLLRKYHPKAIIDIIVFTQGVAEVLQNNPHINAIHYMPKKKKLKNLHKDYDIAIDFEDSKKTRKSIAYSSISTISSERIFSHECAKQWSFIKNYLKCEDPLEGNYYELYPQPKHHQKAQQILKQNKIQKENILIMCHMGCRTIAKKSWKFWKPIQHRKVWPVEKFVSLEEKLQKANPHIRLILTGTKSERALGKMFFKLSQKNNAVDIIDKTGILDLTAIIKQCHIVLTSDTGPLHIACAMMRPIVVFFGPSSPVSKTGPYPKKDIDVIIQKENISETPIEEVFKALIKIIDAKNEL